jgi:hypothetical protein
MAARRSKFTMRKAVVRSEYTTQLELRGDDIKRFFRTPERYLQSLLRKKGVRWRKIRVARPERETVRRATASRVIIVIIKGRWMHIDFDTQDPSRVCEWYFEILDIEIIVLGSESP